MWDISPSPHTLISEQPGQNFLLTEFAELLFDNRTSIR